MEFRELHKMHGRGTYTRIRLSGAAARTGKEKHKKKKTIKKRNVM